VGALTKTMCIVQFRMTS